MPLYLSNRDQEEAITAKEAIEALENGLRQYAKGDAIRRPRIDNFIPTRRADRAPRTPLGATPRSTAQPPGCRTRDRGARRAPGGRA